MAGRFEQRIRRGVTVVVGLLAAALHNVAIADVGAEARAFVEAYVDTFDNGHAAEIVAMFEAPMYMLAPNGDLRTFETAKDIRLTVKKWKLYMIRSGFDHTKLTTLSARSMSDSTALVSTAFDRYSTKGQVFQKGGATYTLRKIEGAWKIWLIHIHDPKDAIAFE